MVQFWYILIICIFAILDCLCQDVDVWALGCIMGAAPIREIRQETVSMSEDHLDSFALLDDKMIKWLMISEIMIAKRSAERTSFWSTYKRACGAGHDPFKLKGSKQNVGERRMDTTAWWHIKVTQVEITSTLPLRTLSKLRLKALLLYKLKAVVGIIRIRLESKKCEILPLLGCCSTSAAWILPIVNGNHWASSIFKAVSRNGSDTMDQLQLNHHLIPFHALRCLVVIHSHLPNAADYSDQLGSHALIAPSWAWSNL